MRQRDFILRNSIQGNTHRNVLYLDLNIRKVVLENGNSKQISGEMKQQIKLKNYQNTFVSKYHYSKLLTILPTSNKIIQILKTIN